MGGTKKKTLASMEKSQTDEGAQPGEGAKKKGEKAKVPVGERKRAEVLMPRMGEQELMKVLTSQKAITVYAAAKSLNVTASMAKTVLGNLESKGMLHRVGGYSGHYVWAPSLATRS
jgi:small subunit ribosomal protein S25e